MSPHEFVIDSFASALKKGERPDCAGLVLIVGWSWGNALSTMYDAMAGDMRQIDPACLHVYDAQYLHCTVATLSSFKNARSILYNASRTDRDRVIATWSQALQRSFERRSGLRPFEVCHTLRYLSQTCGEEELVFRSLESSAAATFLVADDPSNAMVALRAAVKEAADDPQVAKLSAELERKYSHVSGLLSLKEAIHIPDIVHSTVMRHAGVLSDPNGLAEGLAELEAKWNPVTVSITEIYLVFEGHPYMHIGKTEGEMHIFSLS